MASFYGRGSRENARSRQSSVNSIANTPPAHHEEPCIDRSYGPGMYLGDHPSSPIVGGSNSDEDFSFDTVQSTPRLTADFGYSSSGVNYTPESSLFSLNTPSLSDQRRTSAASRERSQSTSTPTGPRREAFPRRNSDIDLRAILQQQQATLETILSNQKQMQTKQSEMEVKLKDLEAKLHVPQAVQSSAPTIKKRKQIVTHEISNKVSKIHTELDQEERFKPDESSTSDHNKKVVEKLRKEVTEQPNNKFSEPVIKAAVKRLYENVRRSYIEQESGKENYVEDQSKRRKYRSRRQRIFDKRTLVVTEREMDMYWQHLSQAYMTEESDDPEDPEKIIQHKLPWRSPKLDEYIALLDQRREKMKRSDSGLVAKKTRLSGSPSQSSPPRGAPSWAIQGSARSEEARSTDH